MAFIEADEARSNSWGADLKAGFLVFLIALPLSLGIAMASGFPPIAGVLTAILGGVLATFLGSARLTIKGPAAGLIVIAIGAVQDLGHGDLVLGYKRALAVGVLAAGVQLALALAGAATIGVAMSPSVVHGMLAAIGVIIIAKQIHIAVGVLPEGKEPLELLAEVPHSLLHANPEILAIGALSLLVLFGLPHIRQRWATMIPGPMVVLLLAIPLGLWFDLDHKHSYRVFGSVQTWEVGPNFLVDLPGSLASAVAFPDFSVAFSPTSLKYVLMYALVGTIESTLSVLAVDSMDPKRRASDLNKDLFAVSIANLASASIGGLPMISEIVRSKANVDAGAQSRWANFFHGCCLLGSVALIPGLLEEIPLAALAAMLIYTGARLASFQEVRHARELGNDQLILFVTTLVMTLATDLLVGVATGLVLKIALHVGRGTPLSLILRPDVVVESTSEEIRIKIGGAATFACLLSVRRAVADLPAEVQRVVIDVTDARIVDHTFLSRLDGFAMEWESAELVVEGLDDLDAISAHPWATRLRRVEV